MRTKKILLLGAVIAGSLTTSVLTPAALAQVQAARITRPAIAESAAALEPIAPVAQDGYRGQGFLRKPPGTGPFPAVVVIHPGLEQWPAELLRGYATSALPSRFLAAGYVVANVTYRSRDVDPQSPLSLRDSVAAVDYVQKLPYVNAGSLAVYGCSGGGDLAVAVASERRVAAIAAEEPASILFTGVFDKTSAKAGPRYTPQDSAPLFVNPRQHYTSERQRTTRAKIAKIQSPILILQGDVRTPLAVNDFNAAVLIPELKSAGKSVEVMTYPGMPHCFAFGAPGATEAMATSAEKAFQEMDKFFRGHLATQPKPVDPSRVSRVPAVAP
jgi:dipeptidyl aminopeptidase/acylaminoacyl peptidase